MTRNFEDELASLLRAIIRDQAGARLDSETLEIAANLLLDTIAPTLGAVARSAVAASLPKTLYTSSHPDAEKHPS